VRRRDFLVAAAVAAGGATAAGVAHWLRRPQESETLEVPTPSDAEAEPDVADSDPLFPPEDEPLVLTFADVVVPRDGESPAASEIDLLPRLEEHVRASASRLRIYRRGWPELREMLEKRIARAPDRPQAHVLRGAMRFCHLSYRRRERSKPRVRLAEQFRRDVLRVYYASPAGWASVGYTGPAYRAPAPGERGEAPA
jgi:hypothetical protein